MKIENKSISRIDFNHGKSTEGYEYDEYDHIDGKAISIEGEGDDEKELIVGTVEAFFINADDSKEPIFYLLDSISGDHERLARYFDDENKINNKIRKLLKLSYEDVEQMSCDFLYFHKLTVIKKYRGLGIGKTLIHSTINDYKRNSSIAFLIAAPLQFSGRETTNDPSLKENFSNRSEAQSRKKLIELYKTYGFKEIPDGEGDMVAYIGDWFYY